MEFLKPSIFYFFFKSCVVLFASSEKTNKINQLKHSIIICNKIDAFL